MLSRGSEKKLEYIPERLEHFFQGIYTDKKSKHYIKISLSEKQRDLWSRKIWSNSTHNILDFSKEVFFPLGTKDPKDLEIVLQLKKYRGFGAKSKSVYNNEASL